MPPSYWLLLLLVTFVNSTIDSTIVNFNTTLIATPNTTLNAPTVIDIGRMLAEDGVKEQIIFMHYCYERIAASIEEHKWIDGGGYREQVVKEAREAVAYWRAFSGRAPSSVVGPRMGCPPPRPSDDWHAP